ncbi:MAG: glycoside hydrolase family 26 protein [Bacteroidota bacterium]
MKKNLVSLWAVFVVLSVVFVFYSCKSPGPEVSDYPANDEIFELADSNATQETRALFMNLLKHRDSSVMFGHQDDLAYGIGWWAEDFRSDVNDVAGKYPAVFGWDVGEIGQGGKNIDNVSFEKMKEWMIKAYEKGGINTISWHLDNPVTGGDSWDTTRAVYSIIPGGEKHEHYKNLLDTLAVFISALKTEEGTMVPVIFRPFHELNGSWFWWGRGSSTVEEYITLFRFTVQYMRDEKNLHNILYSYSTDRFTHEDEYLERFPGEMYVDILGYDDYWSFADEGKIPEGINSLRILAKMGQRMNKPFALTESGYETIPDPQWWTDKLLKPIKSDSLASKLSWLLVWRNHDESHHYAPYPGHPSAENFREFEKDPFTWFLGDLPDMYEPVEIRK